MDELDMPPPACLDSRVRLLRKDAENRRYESPARVRTAGGFETDATCPTCGRWVPPAQALDTDEGRFHDRLECLGEDTYEALVAEYGCVCGTATAQEPPRTIEDWKELLDQEHEDDRSITAMFPIDRRAARRGFCE